MIEVEDVWALIDQFAGPLPSQRVPLEHALGLTLSEDIAADRDCPPFDRATVDGYALRIDDTSEAFTVVGQIPAGSFQPRALELGQAVRILTGAPLPSPGLRVVMQEDARREGNVVRFDCVDGRNFAARGEDFRRGDLLVSAGTKIDAAAAAVLASVGATRPRVVRPPQILHFTSGNEIVPPAAQPREGQIRDGNSALLRGLLAKFPLSGLRHTHLPDDKRSALRLIEAMAPESADVLLFSGGASVGDLDFTGRFLEALGFTRHCASVNVRPGKPLIFASNGARVAFGLPGNPVSHFVCFHLFVARSLARLAGREPPGFLSATLADEIPGRPHSRVTFWPARQRITEGGLEVSPAAWNGSGHLASLLGVDALIRLEANVALSKAGATVSILPTA